MQDDSDNISLPESFNAWLRSEVDRLAHGFAAASGPEYPHLNMTQEEAQQFARQAQKIIINPANSYGYGQGILIEAPSADAIRALPGGDTVKIFSAESAWLQEDEDPEYLALYNREGIPKTPGMHVFRVFPQ